MFESNNAPTAHPLSQRYREYTRQRQYGTGDILLDNRIIFFGCSGSSVYEPVITDQTANLVIQQMLYLQNENRNQEIHFYINSPGGSVTAGMAIYDTMQYIQCDVATICMGLGASMGQFLLCAGEPGKRYSLPHARILMHQPSAQMEGVAADIAIHAEQIIYTKRVMAERIALHTGQKVEQIELDFDRDRWFTAAEAKDYGLIDQVIERSRQVAASN